MGKQKPRNSKELKGMIRDRQKEAQAKTKLLSERIKQSVNAVAATEDGRFLFRYLAHVCGFGKSKVVADIQSKTVDPVSTTFNAAMENVYLQIRRLIHREHLIKIEFSPLQEEE